MRAEAAPEVAGWLDDTLRKAVADVLGYEELGREDAVETTVIEVTPSGTSTMAPDSASSGGAYRKAFRAFLAFGRELPRGCSARGSEIPRPGRTTSTPSASG